MQPTPPADPVVVHSTSPTLTPPTLTSPTPPALAAGAAMTVYFDGSCPLCRREIGVYRGLDALQPLCFADVSDPALVLPAGTSPQALKSRFHVRHADGRLDSGARAFLALWAALPGWRWLARLGSVPGAPHVMEWAYRRFLRVRPLMQRAVLALERVRVRSAGAGTTDPRR